ncbi:MAG: Gfo/Idh/MocA family oxidoreductase [Bryobacterales bacterium]|nr:Gfo/Idh/MocA family oxidoreductase [Bryobacterales bacterium]
MSESRRTFLGTLAAGSAAAATPPAREKLSANGKIQIGIIGAGGRGRFHVGDLSKLKGENIAIVALCDVHRPDLDALAERAGTVFGTTVKKTAEYREMLANPEVDAVILAAPDFTHSQMLEDAVRAGKDVYCEKPMGTLFADAKRAYLAVKNCDRVVQIGTQRRSDPGLMGAAKLMQQGVIGRVMRVDMEVHFQEARWRRDFSKIREQDIDWKRFLMGRSERPFDARRWREWQLFRDYTNGLPGLWMSHFIDLVPWFLGTPYPKSAVASGGVYLWKDGRETEDTFQALLEYPNDCLVRWAMTLTNASPERNLWHGTKGTLDAQAMQVTGMGSRMPDKLTADITIEKESPDTHMQNWLRCIRSRSTPRADIQAGFSHAVAGCMSAEALRTGRRVTFDADRLEIV